MLSLRADGAAQDRQRIEAGLQHWKEKVRQRIAQGERDGQDKSARRPTTGSHATE